MERLYSPSREPVRSNFSLQSTPIGAAELVRWASVSLTSGRSSQAQIFTYRNAFCVRAPDPFASRCYRH